MSQNVICGQTGTGRYDETDSRLSQFHERALKKDKVIPVQSVKAHGRSVGMAALIRALSNRSR